jgi:polar amino acid transport system substrate-binding protein
MLGITSKFLLVPAVAAALLLSGCTSDGATGPAAATQSHLTKILKAKTIKIAVPSQAPPWGVLSASGTYEGYDIDMANALGKALGAKVEFVSGTSDARITNLQTDKADAVMFSFSALNDRAQQVDFSIPYAAVGDQFAVHKDSGIKSYADLAGKKVSLSRGSSAQALMETQFPHSELVLFQSQADSIQALKSDKVDALVELNTIISAVVESDPNLRILEGPTLAPALIAVGVKQGDQQWLNYVNNFIRNWNATSQNETASRKWFHTAATVPAV